MTTRLLMLSATFPYPPSRGGTQVRTFNLLKGLAHLGVEIILITQPTEEVKQEEIVALRSYVKELLLFDRPSVSTQLTGKVKRFLQFLIQGSPPNLLASYSPAIQDYVDRAVTCQDFDIITCEHSVNGVYIRPQYRGKIKTVLNHHSSIYRTCLDQLVTQTSDHPLRDRLYFPLLKRYEKQLISKFDRIVVTTEDDQQSLQLLETHTPIHTLANGVDFSLFPYRQGDPSGYQLVFAGGLDYFANIDSALFLAQEILPKVQQIYPQTRLLLVGSNPSIEIQKLSENLSIKVTGRVPSIAEYLQQSDIAVIPMRTGFGIKNKTLEAMSVGLPVVGSNRALEGLPFPLDYAIRANTVDEYVSAICNLFASRELREDLSKKGRALIENYYDWDKISRSYLGLINL